MKLKKAVNIFLDKGSIVLAAVLVLGLGVYAGWQFTERLGRATADWLYIPEAKDMAHKAFKVTQEKESFRSLRKRVVDTIKRDAARGARSTSVYVGEYERSDVDELMRRLHFRGYKEIHLTSPLSGTNDFLEITW